MMPQIFRDHLCWFTLELVLALVMLFLPRQKDGTRGVAVACLFVALIYALGILLMYGARFSSESYGHLIYASVFGIAMSLVFGILSVIWLLMYLHDAS